MEISTKKQQLLIEFLVASPDTFAMCASIVEPEYFDPEFRKAVRFLKDYYDEYNSLPSPDQIAAETSVELKEQQVTHDQIEYVADEIEEFCKYSALERAILGAPKLVAEGNYGAVETTIRDALTISLNRDIGLDYFEDVRERLERQEKTGARLSTGWKEVDELLFGGHARKELLVFSANSGVGKSVILANYGLNQAEMGRRVLYISLELSEDLVSQRYDTMISGVPTATWKYNKEKIIQSVERKAETAANITIKRMNSGTTARDIRAYLKEYELKKGYIPDILIVDYLDIMGSNEKVSADNVFEKDKRAAEQLRDIGNDYNIAVATASQQNRGAVDETRIRQSHVAGGISKINTSDTWISIIATEAMKAAGECRFQFVKTRTSDGVGKMVTLKWQANIRVVDADSPSVQAVTLPSRSDPTRPPTMGADEASYIAGTQSGRDPIDTLDDLFDID
jgi:KaiC/GvpD/RAD55 family RecA-like ATPase